MLTIVHIVNQFFAGLGGEEKAGSPVVVVEGGRSSTWTSAQLGDRGKVVATIYFGDNYFHEHVEEAKGVIVREVEKRRPDVVVAGPAFNSGRYGLASVEICQAVAEGLGIGCVVGMDAENPAIPAYREYRNRRFIYFGGSAAGIHTALSVMARFACRVKWGRDKVSGGRGIPPARHPAAGTN
jgi:glycine reductase